MRLLGKSALVTGSARGIGKGIAELFLEEGANVILLDRKEKELEETCKVFYEKYGSVDYIVCDVASESQTKSAAESAWERHGKIDILVNNAGIAKREPFLEMPTANWSKILEVNLTSMFRLGQLIARKMAEQNTQGSIVNMGSKNGLAAGSQLAHYNSSKAGVNLLTQSMAVELAEYQIRVNAVAPGFIETPLDTELKMDDTSLSLTNRTPMKRLGTIREVANTVLFLASEEASYITGTTIVVDGGHLANASEL